MKEGIGGGKITKEVETSLKTRTDRQASKM
jgi:hypothetical protein